MPDTQVRLPWKMNRAPVLNFILISLSITGILLRYSGKWWQMLHKPREKEELQCTRTLEIQWEETLAEAS